MEGWAAGGIVRIGPLVSCTIMQAHLLKVEEQTALPHTRGEDIPAAAHKLQHKDNSREPVGPLYKCTGPCRGGFGCLSVDPTWYPPPIGGVANWRPTHLSPHAKAESCSEWQMKPEFSVCSFWSEGKPPGEEQLEPGSSGTVPVMASA